MSESNVVLHHVTRVARTGGEIKFNHYSHPLRCLESWTFSSDSRHFQGMIHSEI